MSTRQERRREEREAEDELGKNASSIRIYFYLEGEEAVSEVVDALTGAVVALGFNQDDESANCLMAVVTKAPDVKAWAEGDNVKFSRMVSRVSSAIVFPGMNDAPEVEL